MNNEIARKCSDGRTQGLKEHTENVANISIVNSCYPKISELIAFVHDIGKVSDAFQNYITYGGERGSVIHAWQGAFLINDMFTNNSTSEVLLREIVAFCVTAHHNSIPDGVSPDGSTGYYDKILNYADEKYSFENIKRKISDTDAQKIKTLYDNAKGELETSIHKIKEVYKERHSAGFSLGLFVKYLYSCLVDADRLDAYLFEVNEKFKSRKLEWDVLIDIFENNISKYPNVSDIDHIRRAISNKCKAAAVKDTDIYQLSVPTGGGKTLSSLRFALHHCGRYNKKRIIYVIPYLSIIEQTADNIRKIFDLSYDNEIVFEHHSNIMEPEDDKADEMRKLSSSRWDSPIIITTMVQFLESVMSARSSKLRKFASMADSVIIFDEIQSMPIKAIHCFMK